MGHALSIETHARLLYRICIADNLNAPLMCQNNVPSPMCRLHCPCKTMDCGWYSIGCNDLAEPCRYCPFQA